MRRVLWWAGIGLSMLVVGIVVLVAVFDWSWIKGYVARQASEAIGHTVVIEGNLDIDFTWPPLIQAEQVRVANVSWSKEPYMLEIRRLACRIDLHALLQGRFVLPMIELVEPVVRLETSEQGEANWKFQPTQTVADQAAPGALPIIERLSLRDGRRAYYDYASNKSITATLTEVQAATTGPEQHLEVEGAGQLADIPFRLTGHGGALQDLHGNKPYPLQVQLVVDQWQGDLNGTVAQPLQLQGVAVEVSLARVFPDQPSGNQEQVAQAAPGQAPYRLTGHLTREGDVWAVRELAGTLGKSDLAGVVSIDLQGKRPFLEAEIFSRTLDARDLSIPKSASGQPTSPGAAANKGEDLPPDAVLDLELTRAVNARLRFQGNPVVIADQTLHNVSADLALQDGHLSLRPVFAVAGGPMRAQIEVEDRGEAPLHSAVQADIAHVNVQQVLAALGMEHKAAGSVDGHVDLAASGRSLPPLLSSLAGKAALTVRDQASHTDFRMTLATERETPQAKSGVRLISQGRVRGEPFHLEGRVGSWYGGQQPFPVQMQLRLGETRARLDGTLRQGPQRTGLAAQVAIQGPDPARLSALLSSSVPSLPAYRFEGRLLQNGSTWTLKEFKGSLGDSDLAGELSGKLGTAGKLDAQIDLTGTGRSLADFLASANGNVLLSMVEGQMGKVLIELVGLDVAETIEKAIAKEKTYQLRCLVADFAVQNGRMETQMLLVDTNDTKVIGGGFIDLQEKKLGLKLDPKSKDFSLFSAQAPLYIIGHLAKPSAGPKLGEVLLSLSMPIKLGKPENADCQAVLEASQRRYQTSQP